MYVLCTYSLTTSSQECIHCCLGTGPANAAAHAGCSWGGGHAAALGLAAQIVQSIIVCHFLSCIRLACHSSERNAHCRSKPRGQLRVVVTPARCIEGASLAVLRAADGVSPAVDKHPFPSRKRQRAACHLPATCLCGRQALLLMLTLRLTANP